jgi:hypothetical protein
MKIGVKLSLINVIRVTWIFDVKLFMGVAFQISKEYYTHKFYIF